MRELRLAIRAEAFLAAVVLAGMSVRRVGDNAGA
jgi:hypothetical protein